LGDVGSLPLETGDKIETLPIESGVGKTADSSGVNAMDSGVASLMNAANESLPLETRDKIETLPIDSGVGKTADSSGVNAMDSGVASLLTAASILTSETVATDSVWLLF
jgi:predicted regulator of Ras-like GTPase activity (Roadblock/LC7/MglB family)